MRTRSSSRSLTMLALAGAFAGCGAESLGDEDLGQASAELPAPGCGALDTSFPAPPATDAGSTTTSLADAGDAARTATDPPDRIPGFTSVGTGCSAADTTLTRSSDGNTVTVKFGRFAARRDASSNAAMMRSCLMFLPLQNGAQTYALERIEVSGTAQLPAGARGHVNIAPGFTGRGSVFDKRITIEGPKEGAFSAEATLAPDQLQFIPCQADVTRRADLDTAVTLDELAADLPPAATSIELANLTLHYRARDCSGAKPLKQ